MAHRIHLWLTVLACGGAFLAGVLLHPRLTGAWAVSPPAFGEVAAGNFAALAPIVLLKQRLGEQQKASLTSDDARAPLLARTEILSARSLLSPPELGEDPQYDARRMRAGFLLRARLYWVTPDTGSGLPRGGVRIARFTGPSGTLLWREEGLRIRQLRVETVDYTLEPNAVTAAPPAGEIAGVTAQPALIEGGTGWTISHRRLVKTHDVDYSTRPCPLPLSDVPWDGEGE